MNWFINNLGTIAVALVLIAIITVTIRSMLSDKRKGKSSCGCRCSSCPMGASCHRAPAGQGSARQQH
ncbi:MAG: FeoB-associated Cys-rich membrane protein [Lachnospiraceae bacterium]|nr:FeoB-associated Cys-rich membrane protein [Lachnospiraceae bacterium]